MQIARISSQYNITLGNSIPNTAWTSVTASVVNVSVASTQALVVLKVTGDSFSGFCFTPREDATYGVYQGAVYCLFTKPSGFTVNGMGIAFKSPIFTDPVLFMNGVDVLPDYPSNATAMNYYKFDIRPYFLESN